MAKILIIDKDVKEALMEEAALEFKDHEVRIQSDQGKALASIAEGWPDLVILDPNHPVTVPAVHAALEATETRARIPLLLVSSPHEGASLGGDGLADGKIEHPFDVAALQARVEKLLTSGN
jgi:DNA-binding response OmpR family regulator